MSGGRPTVWTKEVEDRVFYALEIGLSRRRAADYARINRSTLFDRISSDPEFSDRCNTHEAEGMVFHAERIREAPDMTGPGQGACAVQAAKLYLSTRGEDAWVEKKSVEHSGAIDLASAAAEVSSSIDEAMAAEDDD